MSPQRSYAAGASATRIGSTSQNGYLMSGIFPSTRTPATQPDHQLTVPDQHAAIRPTRPQFLSSIIAASASQVPARPQTKLQTRTSRKTRDLARQNPRHIGPP